MSPVTMKGSGSVEDDDLVSSISFSIASLSTFSSRVSSDVVSVVFSIFSVVA